MRTILIVFATLLVLLTLLGAFGGSIKYSEPFYVSATNVRYEEPFQNLDMMPSQPHSSFVNSEAMDMPGMPTDAAETYENLHVNGPKSQFYDAPQTPSTFHESKAAVEEGFYIEPFEEDKNDMPAAY